MNFRSLLAIVTYFETVFLGSLKGTPDALSSEIGYSPDSKQLVVELDLPDFDAVSEESSYKYVKSSDSIEPLKRPIAKRKALYSNLISQITLKAIDTTFRADRLGCVDGIPEM